MNNIRLCDLLNCIDGTDDIKVVNYNDEKTIYRGKKFDCNLHNFSVVVVYATCECELVIKVV